MTVLDRRAILSLSTAAAASALFACSSTSSGAAHAHAAGKKRKALGIGMIGAGDTLADKFRLAGDCGFAGVEMDGPSDHRHEDVLAARFSRKKPD